MTNELTMAEHLTQQIARDTKKLNRRSSWIIKIMESQWPTYLLPITRIIEAIGIQGEAQLADHKNNLVQLLAKALNEYRAGAEKICEKSGLMPYEIPDATRYAMYLSGLVDEVIKRFECVEANDRVTLKARPKPSTKTSKKIEVRGQVYFLLCSDTLQEYMRETGNEQAIVADAASDCA
jgi:hypothetical protein